MKWSGSERGQLGEHEGKQTPYENDRKNGPKGKVGLRRSPGIGEKRSYSGAASGVRDGVAGAIRIGVLHFRAWDIIAAHYAHWTGSRSVGTTWCVRATTREAYATM